MSTYYVYAVAEEVHADNSGCDWLAGLLNISGDDATAHIEAKDAADAKRQFSWLWEQHRGAGDMTVEFARPTRVKTMEV